MYLSFTHAIILLESNSIYYPKKNVYGFSLGYYTFYGFSLGYYTFYGFSLGYFTFYGLCFVFTPRRLRRRRGEVRPSRRPTHQAARVSSGPTAYHLPSSGM